MFCPVLLASLLGARLLVTHRTVSALLPAPSLCYVLTHHPRSTNPLSLLFRFSRFSRVPSSRSGRLASVSRVPFPPLSLRPPLVPRVQSLAVIVRLLAPRSQSGVLPFFPFSPARRWCEDERLSNEKVPKVEEEVME